MFRDGGRKNSFLIAIERSGTHHPRRSNQDVCCAKKTFEKTKCFLSEDVSIRTPLTRGKVKTMDFVSLSANNCLSMKKGSILTPKTNPLFSTKVSFLETKYSRILEEVYVAE